MTLDGCQIIMMCILEGVVQEYLVRVGYTPPKKIVPPLMILDHLLH